MTLVAALLLTIGVEGVIASLILRRFCVIESTAIQLTTWPFAQLIAMRTGLFWPVELAVVLTEIMLWRLVLPLSWRRASVVSLVTNGATIAISLL